MKRAFGDDATFDADNDISYRKNQFFLHFSMLYLCSAFSGELIHLNFALCTRAHVLIESE